MIAYTNVADRFHVTKTCAKSLKETLQRTYSAIHTVFRDLASVRQPQTNSTLSLKIIMRRPFAHDLHKPFIRQCIFAGEHNASQLYREIVTQSNSGAKRSVINYVAQLRPQIAIVPEGADTQVCPFIR